MRSSGCDDQVVAGVDLWLAELAARLVRAPGVVGVALGGSRARSAHADESDYDLGVYYQRPLDTDALGELARAVAGPGARVTEPGGWGPWVDGGAWLRINGAAAPARRAGFRLPG